MGKVEISYSTSPLSEYIGSHVYELLGQEVHETRLGIYNGKCVVACKNFLSPGETLLEFKDIKNMYSEKMEQMMDSYSDAVEGPILNMVLEMGVITDRSGNNLQKRERGSDQAFYVHQPPGK